MQEIENAITAWNTANQQSGNNTQFVTAGPNNPISVTFTADAANTGGSASTNVGRGLIDSANPAMITFHPQSTFQGGSALAFQPSATGYNTAYLQSALHEIGHLMGIGDYGNPSGGNVTEPPPGSSVMNSFYGVNNTGG